MHSFLKEIYHTHFSTHPKEFIELLTLVSNYDIASIQRTINILTQKCIDVNIENIKMILNRNNNLEDTAKSTTSSSLQTEIEENSKRHLSMYDAIIGTTGIEGGVAV